VAGRLRVFRDRNHAAGLKPAAKGLSILCRPYGVTTGALGGDLSIKSTLVGFPGG
jgi:hypothetical protein